MYWRRTAKKQLENDYYHTVSSFFNFTHNKTMIKKTVIKIYSLINNLLHHIWFKLEYIWSHKYIWIKKLWIKTILDVWANRGQSVDRRRSLLGTDLIFHCFEPLKHPYSVLKNRFEQDKKIHLHHYALGEEESHESMYVSNIDDSSSLLPPTDTMSDAYQQIHFDQKQDITVKKLDDLWSTFRREWLVMMKVDTQWFEGKVFAWAKQSLKHIGIIVVELSFQEFYEGQPLFNEICSQLEEYGFRYYWSFEQSADPRDGRPLQQDAFFISNALSQPCI